MNKQKGFTPTASIIIILVAIVVLAGIFYLSKEAPETNINEPPAEDKTAEPGNDANEPKPNENKNNPAGDEKKEPEKVGIVITSPKPNEEVKLPIKIEGYINGNGWYANEGEAGGVQVFDANGKSVAGPKPLKTVGDWMKLPTYFEVLVGDRQMMSHLETDAGEIVFKSRADKDGEIVQERRLPIRFENNQISRAVGYIKNVYQKDGKNYLDIDYIQLCSVHPSNSDFEECTQDKMIEFEKLGLMCGSIYNYEALNLGEKYDPQWCTSGLTYINENPKLRTFEISEDVKIMRTELATERFVKIDQLKEAIGRSNGESVYYIQIQKEKIIGIAEIFRS